MSKDNDCDARWYEAQRLGPGKWVLWERFLYYHESTDGAVRLRARRGAIKAAKDCALKHKCPVRVVHVQRVFRSPVE